ncbi:hypothetical protein BJP40_12795 [Streptomyces sp. CC53]|uniref:hypothetical protein n=1 Tax=unclassified Streptomyces TaxID=2593676 RepID=UPI0008DDE41D|nr:MULTISPECIES: hypothetical protein [unclassified Streptomyces]OII59740.1 hypothetical protein BJP40_12795 [Streptomyces sp. CC53]
MKALLLRLGGICVGFLALLVVLGAQTGTRELAALTAAAVVAVAFTVRRHRRRAPGARPTSA